MLKYVLLCVGIIPSALAQIMLKKSTAFMMRSVEWYAFIGISILLYGLAFVLYAIVMRYFPISKASPIMTVGVMLVVVAFGLCSGEEFQLRNIIGLLLGLMSIFLIL